MQLNGAALAAPRNAGLHRDFCDRWADRLTVSGRVDVTPIFWIHLDLETGSLMGGQMRRKRFTEEQIIGIVKEPEAGGAAQWLRRGGGDAVVPQARKSSATYYTWEVKIGGLEISDAKRLLADTMLDNTDLEDPLLKRGGARLSGRTARACGIARAGPVMVT